jgi:hypothetical protein
VLKGRFYFLRGCLDLPVHGSDQVFRWLGWVNVSEGDFLRTGDLWNPPGREAEPPYPGWLDSALPGYPQTLGLEVRVAIGSTGCVSRRPGRGRRRFGIFVASRGRAVPVNMRGAARSCSQVRAHITRR